MSGVRRARGHSFDEVVVSICENTNIYEQYTIPIYMFTIHDSCRAHTIQYLRIHEEVLIHEDEDPTGNCMHAEYAGGCVM